MYMCVSQTVFTSVSELTRGFFLLFSLTHTHTHTRVGYVYVCGELFGHEASTCCNRSEKCFTHAVTWPHTHTHTHTRIQTQRRTCKSTQALHTHTPAVSLIDRLQERNIYTHTHSLSVNTSLRLVGGKHSPASDFSLDHVQGSGRNVLIASAFVHTHTHTT